MNFTYYWFKIIKKLRGKAISNSQIHKTSKVEAGSEIVNSTFDKHSFCGYNCMIMNCKIGSFCSIANNVIIGGAMHPVNWVSTSPVFYEGRDSVRTKFSTHKRTPDQITIIEHDVWIGEKSIIKQGVKIGIGAVIGMGSIVTKDVEPYSIVGGNPARLIRKRFDDETINLLLESKWWNFDDQKLSTLGKFIQNPKEFIRNI